MGGRWHVAVVGAGVADAATTSLAEELGAELGRRGAVIVCGGLGGVMEAACRGARSVGATTVGILPGDDRRAANPYVDVAVATGMGEGRNVLIVRSADVVVAVAGEFGTLSEIALALRLGRSVIGLSTWELVRDGQPVDVIIRADDPRRAAELAQAAAEEGRPLS
jgi:uncharacterized protein (TIGR00725 family)